jgi:hypothetical protein
MAQSATIQDGFPFAPLVAGAEVGGVVVGGVVVGGVVVGGVVVEGVVVRGSAPWEGAEAPHPMISGDITATPATTVHTRPRVVRIMREPYQ